jgi:hypothetical protein
VLSRATNARILMVLSPPIDKITFSYIIFILILQVFNPWYLIVSLQTKIFPYVW